MGISGWLSDLCAAETDEPWAQEELAKAFFSGTFHCAQSKGRNAK